MTPPTYDEIDEVLSAAWQDLAEWRRLAREQRAASPNPNHAPNMPSQAGIDHTTAVMATIGKLTKRLLAALPASSASKMDIAFRESRHAVVTEHINAALVALQSVGAHTLLTDAEMHLLDAQRKVKDHAALAASSPAAPEMPEKE